MIQRSSSSKPAGSFRGDHQAAASATPVIFAGIDAGHRTPTGDLVGSPCLRRSTVLSKPADLPGERMANCSGSCGAPVPPGRYGAKFLGVRHEAVFEIAEGMNAGEVVRLPFTDGDYAEEMAPAIDRLLNSGNARDAAQRLHDALARFLNDGDGGERAADVVNHAGDVLNALGSLKFEIGAD